MSKNTQGYLGPQIGKLGPAVGFLWKGRNIFRSYNPFVRNPKTPAQVEARAKFKLLAQTARLLSQAVDRVLVGRKYLHLTKNILIFADVFVYLKWFGRDCVCECYGCWII